MRSSFLSAFSTSCLLGLVLLPISDVFAEATPEAPVTQGAVVATYATIVYRNYADALGSATMLQQAIHAFLASPSNDGLHAARKAWLAAREDYNTTEDFRFYGGPIDADPENVETKINGWPLDEQWVDYTVDTPDTGIINAAKDYPVLSPDLLVELNEHGGEKNISTGYHAIEFLLWGQDLSKTGPGDRPFTDYVDGGTAKHQDRRREYLRQVGDLLVRQLTQVTNAWDPAVAGNYRTAFLAAPPAESLKKAISGLITLAGDELSGERLAVAYETQDQEEEQSCFSDNTHRDTILNIQGIANIWLGTYKDFHGPGLQDVVQAADPAAAATVLTHLTAASDAAKRIPVPFDQAILGSDKDPGRVAILATIENLENTTDDLVAAAKTIGITIEFGANANNAIVGLKDLAAQLPTVIAAAKAGDKAAAKVAVDDLFDRWIRIETAVSRESPINYKRIESALNTLKNEAIRARSPTEEKVQAAAAALTNEIQQVMPLLKKN